MSSRDISSLSHRALTLDLFDTLLPFLYLLLRRGGNSVLWFSSGFSTHSCSHEHTVCVCVCVLSVDRGFIMYITSCTVYLNEDQALEDKRSFNSHGDCYTGFPLLAVIHPLHHPEKFNSKSLCSFLSFLTIFPFFAVARRCNQVLRKQF